jgi:hypothetical protein
MFQRAVAAIPLELRDARILRMQDALIYAYVLKTMTGLYRYVPTIGEVRHFGWQDNSQSAAYQSLNATKNNVAFVSLLIEQMFGRPIMPV